MNTLVLLTLVALAAPAAAVYRLDGFAGAGVGDGAPALAASIAEPGDAVTDSHGNVYFCDRPHAIVRRVDAATGVITTVAGNGATGGDGDGGPATHAQLNGPDDLSLDASETHLYIVENLANRVRVVDLVTGTITRFAGTGIQTGSVDGEGGDPSDDLGDGGPAKLASFNQPVGIRVSPSGDVFVGERSESWPTVEQHRPRIRRIDGATGIITTYAGGNQEGYNGENHPALDTQLADPISLKLDGSGKLWFGELGNHRVRVIDAAPPNIIRSVAGNSSYYEGAVQPYAGDGGPALSATLDWPSRIALLPRGCGGPAPAAPCTLYIGDSRHYCVRAVDPNTHIINAVAGVCTSFGDSGDGGPALIARMGRIGVNEGPNGTILVADDDALRIRLFDPVAGTIRPFAGDGTASAGGDGGPATRAYLFEPRGLAHDAAGNVFIADHGNHRVRRVAADGTIFTVAGGPERGGKGDEGPAGSAQLDEPTGLALTPAGDLLIVDALTHTIRRIDPQGTIHAFAGIDGQAGGSGDGGPATQATLDTPLRAAVAPNGDVYVVELNDHVVRRIDAAGTITRFAGTTGQPGDAGDGGPALQAELDSPAGLAIGADGSVYVADFGNERIRVVGPDGTINPVAGTGERGHRGDGGPAGAATFSDPTGLALDKDGGLLVADQGNNVIRRIAPDAQGHLGPLSIVTTILCDGTPTFAGEGGDGSKASCNRPTDVLPLADGTILVSDSSNERVRIATPVANLCDVGCDDRDPCTVDSCDPVVGCGHTADPTCLGGGGGGGGTTTACTKGDPSCIAGGGPRKTDCLVETVVTGATGRTVRCTDDDTSCDADPTPGTCRFAVSWCINNKDPRLACTASGLTALTLGAAPRRLGASVVTGAIGAVVQVAGSNASTAGPRLRFTPAFTAANQCTAPLAVDVPLRGRARRPHPGKLRLRTAASAGKARDADVVTLVCTPSGQ